VAFHPDLAVQATVALATGLVYVFVARLIMNRHPSTDARLANSMFAVWWGAFGLLEFSVGAYQVPAAFGFQDLALVIALLNLILLLIVVALWGLVYYLVYLYTGSSRSFWPITILYMILAAAMLYLVAWIEPTGFKADGTLSYTRQLTGFPSIAIGLAFSLPVVLAALGYGSLYFQAQARTQRFRIGMVAGSFLAWFSWSALSALLQLSQKAQDAAAAGNGTIQNTLIVVNSAISIIVPILIVLAYRPPRWFQDRFRIGSVQEG